jgi:hypothetical protein
MLTRLNVRDLEDARAQPEVLGDGGAALGVWGEGRIVQAGLRPRLLEHLVWKEIRLEREIVFLE